MIKKCIKKCSKKTNKIFTKNQKQINMQDNFNTPHNQSIFILRISFKQTTNYKKYDKN